MLRDMPEMVLWHMPRHKIRKEKSKMSGNRPYPSSVCYDCAMKAGGKTDATSTSTMHRGTCGVCHKPAIVTEPRDYGYPQFRGHMVPSLRQRIL